MLGFLLLAPTGYQWGRGRPTGSRLPERALTAGTSTPELSERLTGGGTLSNECVVAAAAEAHNSRPAQIADLARTRGLKRLSRTEC